MIILSLSKLEFSSIVSDKEECSKASVAYFIQAFDVACPYHVQATRYCWKLLIYRKAGIRSSVDRPLYVAETDAIQWERGIGSVNF